MAERMLQRFALGFFMIFLKAPAYVFDARSCLIVIFFEKLKVLFGMPVGEL